MQKKEKDFHLEKATESTKDVDENVCQHATASIHPSKMQIPDLPAPLSDALVWVCTWVSNLTCTAESLMSLYLHCSFIGEDGV